MHRTLPPPSIAFALVAALTFAQAARAGDWPAFRGPQSNGLSTETGVPTEWDGASGKNIAWKAALPAPGNGSPIVVGDNVLVTCSQDEGMKRGLYCFNRADGKLKWERIVDFDKKLPRHGTNPHCASTPASDGKRVVVWHMSAGLFCYDLAGKELWRTQLGEFVHMWGDGSSPIIHNGRIYLNCAPGAKAFMACLNLADGKVVWQVDEPADGDGQKRTDGAPMGTWSTPQIIKRDGQEQVVVFQPNRVIAYHPADGRTLWFCRTKNEKGDLAYSSAVIEGDICIAAGGYSGGATAFKLGGTGDITETNTLWYKPRNPQSIGTGVTLSGYLYIPDAGPGTIRCLEAATGKELWTSRESGANHWGSIVMADGLAFVTNQKGATIAFRPNPEKFDLVAKNELGEDSNSTPAFSNGQAFVRTFEHLYCIGGK